MFKQQTLAGSFSLYGKGLHTGLSLTVTFNPAPENHGYKIQRIDLPGEPIIEAIAENVVDTSRGTVVAKGEARCSTIEHAMAALYALGIDNCLIRFAHCCTPIPGDHILGYVTKGAGVSIHRADCANIISLLKNAENSERVIKVRWATKTEEYYSAAIQITGVNRIGILADITRLISEMNISLTSMKANDISSNVVIDVTVNLRNAEQLGQLVIKLKKIEGVEDVTRIIR